MSNNQENTALGNSDELDYSEKATKKRSNRWNWLIYLACFVIAFGFWFYVDLSEDPIVPKGFGVEYVLVDGDEFEYISSPFGYFTFYGKKSVIDKMQGPIIVSVNKSEFVFEDGTVIYNVPLKVKIDYPDGIYSHNLESEEFKLTLTQKNNKVIDDTSSDK